MKQLLIGMLLFPVAERALAQQPFTNAGHLTIHSGANLTVYGNFVNAATAGLVNDGNLYVKGNLHSNQSAMSTGNGTLHLNGTSAQTLDGLQPFNTFNLVSNNSAGMLLNADLHVSGAHSFTTGVITTAATPNYLVYEDGSSYSGNGDGSHINGWVKKTGATNFIFPVGNGTVQRTVSINNLSGSSSFAVKYMATTPNTNQLQSPIISLDPNEYWEVSKVSGGTATVTLHWDNSKVAFPGWIVSDIHVAGYNGSLWVSQGGSASGNATTTGTITSNSMSSFSRFTFGSTSAILPLTLISFDAKRKNEKSEITWKTAGEQHVSHFIVERSDNGADFYPIGKVTARNSGHMENYALSDEKSIATGAWYRLRSVDMDGAAKLSHIVRVSEASNGSLLFVNNPVRDQLILTTKGNLTGEFDYSLHDTYGKVVQRGKVVVRRNTQTIVPLSGPIPTGSYTISLRQSSLFISKKIIIASTHP
jgi:hypothetical protein